MNKILALLVLRPLVSQRHRIHMPVREFRLGGPIPQAAIDLFRSGPECFCGGRKFAELNNEEQIAIMSLVRRFSLSVVMRLRNHNKQEAESKGKRVRPAPVKGSELIKDEKVLDGWHKWLGPKTTFGYYYSEDE